MIEVRDARPGDVEGIRDVFHACYGAHYPHAQYYDLDRLTRMVYSEGQVLLVAEDADAHRVVGTASVVLETSAMSDLVAEFGRLAVHPDARGAGVGRRLMRERLARVRDRLHVGYVEARVAHPFSARIAEALGFHPVGFLPLKMELGGRETVCLMAQHFGEALALRRNHPRVIPEAYALAQLALQHCGLPTDVVVDDESAAYRPAEGLEARELTAEGYSPLLRIERGRVRHREVFGAMRLHYGLFKLRSSRSHYLLAMNGDRVEGGLGWTEDPIDRVVTVFELIALDDAVARFLLERLERNCRDRGTAFVNVDVSAHAPAMQRTLLELGFLPAAYVPAMAFSEVERIDIVKMVRLLVSPEFPPMDLGARAEAMRHVVLEPFARQRLLPRIERAVGELPLFRDLSVEQVARLAGACALARFEPGEHVIDEGGGDATLHVVLSGQASVCRSGRDGVVGMVGPGECLGERSLLTGQPHSATAVAAGPVETAALGHADFASLVRARPDIGLVVYRNLALGLGDKLHRVSTTH
jgi:GNAT superfamily N-acetyltransferase